MIARQLNKPLLWPIVPPLGGLRRQLSQRPTVCLEGLLLLFPLPRAQLRLFIQYLSLLGRRQQPLFRASPASRPSQTQKEVDPAREAR